MGYEEKISRRSRRPALLSEHERELVKKADSLQELTSLRDECQSKGYQVRARNLSGQIEDITRRYGTFVRALDYRLDELNKDLLTILSSTSLRPLLVVRKLQFEAVNSILQQIREVILAGRSNYASVRVVQVVIGNRRKYWLDIHVKPEPTSENIFSPEYATRNIKGVWKTKNGLIDVRHTLETAISLERKFYEYIEQGRISFILPRTEAEAVSIHEVIERIDYFRQQIKLLAPYHQNTERVQQGAVDLSKLGIQMIRAISLFENGSCFYDGLIDTLKQQIPEYRWNFPQADFDGILMAMIRKNQLKISLPDT